MKSLKNFEPLKGSIVCFFFFIPLKVRQAHPSFLYGSPRRKTIMLKAHILP